MQHPSFGLHCHASSARLGLLGIAVAAALLGAGSVRAATGQDSVRPLVASVPMAVMQGAAERLAPMEASQKLHFSLVLPLRDEDQLDALLVRLQDPSSPDYHRYLSVDEFTARFGANAQDYAEVVRWAEANGLAITEIARNRHIVGVQGSVAAINRALHVQMRHFRNPGETRTYFAADREPSIDLRVPLLAITGLDDARPKVNRMRRGSTVQTLDAVTQVHGSGPSGNYLPSDIRAAYYGKNGKLTGKGQVVGIFSFDGYHVGDLNLFYSRTGMVASVPVENVLVNTGGACSGGLNCDDGEQILDIVNVIGMAPGLKKVQFYEGPSATQILNRMVSDNTAKVISCSWGGGDFDNRTDDAIYKEMAAQGQTYLNATGDDGAYNAQTWLDPSADPNIVNVGGTVLTTSGPGGHWVSEKGWSYSGGGYYAKANEKIPSWQKSAGVITATNHGSKTYRNDPDVAGEADFDNPTVSNGQFQTGWGGTSFAAPRWAGLLALANQKSVALGHGTVGFVNPKLYAIGRGTSYATTFHDIRQGNNKPDLGQGAGFNAVAGYDLVTGWGSPRGAALINALVTP